MDDLAQTSNWRSRPAAEDPQPPFASPIVFRLPPPAPRRPMRRMAQTWANRLGGRRLA